MPDSITRILHTAIRFFEENEDLQRFKKSTRLFLSITKDLSVGFWTTGTENVTISSDYMFPYDSTNKTVSQAILISLNLGNQRRMPEHLSLIWR